MLPFIKLDLIFTSSSGTSKMPISTPEISTLVHKYILWLIVWYSNVFCKLIHAALDITSCHHGLTFSLMTEVSCIERSKDTTSGYGLFTSFQDFLQTGPIKSWSPILCSEMVASLSTSLNCYCSGR